MVSFEVCSRLWCVIGVFLALCDAVRQEIKFEKKPLNSVSYAIDSQGCLTNCKHIGTQRLHSDVHHKRVSRVPRQCWHTVAITI